jgi:hypothetical protein
MLWTAVINDLHTGSTVGLWPGRHAIEGGGIYEANLPQQWLLECWHHMEREVMEKAQTESVNLVLLGDTLQGVNYRDGELIGSNMAHQVDAALNLLGPIAEAAETVYSIRGTEWHEGKASEYVELLSRELGAKPDPTTGQYSRWEMYLDMGGPTIHFAHHIGVSSVPWYEATVPTRDMLMQMAELWRFYGAKAPNLKMIVRAHRHRMVHVQLPPDLQVFVNCGWQLKTAFAHKKASAMLPQIGWAWLVWDGDDLIVKPRIYQLPPIAVETLSC